MTDMVGKILHNRYKILRPVGVGGMAEVYLAQDMLLDREVAVKILRAQFNNDKSLLEQFRREAQSAARLIHPSIVNIFDVCEENSLYFRRHAFIDKDIMRFDVAVNNIAVMGMLQSGSQLTGNMHGPERFEWALLL